MISEIKIAAILELYPEIKNLKEVSKVTEVPWQTVYYVLRKHNIPVTGDKATYGGYTDQVAVIGEGLFKTLIPYAKDQNTEAFQPKYDFLVGGMKIDVKTSFIKDGAKKGNNPRYRWAFSTRTNGDADFTVMYCLSGTKEDWKVNNILLVPKEYTENRQSISVTVSGSKWYDFKVESEDIKEMFDLITGELNE